MTSLVRHIIKWAYRKQTASTLASHDLIPMLVSRQLAETLEDNWSMPVQVQFARKPGTEDWMLLFRRVSLKTYQEHVGREIVAQAARQ